MLIDDFMPGYDFSEKHETRVRASAEKVYATVNSIDLAESRIIGGLLTLRGLGRKSAKTLTLRDMTKDGFAVLGEKPDEEVLLGVAGKFWTPSGCLQNINANNFREFDTKGYAKAAWNFALKETGKDEILLTTETRVKCSDKASLSTFGFYWRFVQPFSGLIRREMLRLIKRKAEASSVNPDAE
jgi:hypothetical protein